MKYNWEDLPEKKNCITVKNTTMINLNTGKTVRHYSPNTRINVVQKCVTPEKTWYRTADAAYNYLNYAFEAEAFGLPNEKAPSAPSTKLDSLGGNTSNSMDAATRAQKPAKKQKSVQKIVPSKGGERRRNVKWFSKIFRRKNG